MPVIREEVTIKAPAERVWTIVQEDLQHAPDWTGYLVSARLLNARKPKEGSQIRYELDLGGWRGHIDMEQDEFDPPRHCSGRFVDGPLRGTWSYDYSPVRGGTRLVVEMNYELTGLLRFAGGMLKGTYEEGVRRSLTDLKAYIETGRVVRR